MRVIVLMGVAGSGKSTIGAALATHLGAPFIEGDLLHPESNIRKIAAGKPLTDADRLPWLEAIQGSIRAHAGTTAVLVVACSALRESYREIVRRTGCPTTFVLLSGERSILDQRLRARQGHFFPPTLLASQLETLEPPHDALVIDINQTPQAAVEQIAAALNLSASG